MLREKITFERKTVEEAKHPATKNSGAKEPKQLRHSAKLHQTQTVLPHTYSYRLINRYYLLHEIIYILWVMKTSIKTIFIRMKWPLYAIWKNYSEIYLHSYKICKLKSYILGFVVFTVCLGRPGFKPQALFTLQGQLIFKKYSIWVVVLELFLG